MSFGIFQFRRDTAANWTSANPTLLAGEFGLETDTLAVKLGDGTTAWTSLGYYSTKIRTGTTVPSNSLGVNGDLYIRTTTGDLYLRSAGTYSIVANLTGPTGSTGSTGAPGAAGVVQDLTAGSSKVSIGGSAAHPTVDVVPANFTGIPESGITGLTTDLAAKAPAARLINTTAPLTGGGDLSADRTLAISAATASAAGSQSAVDKKKEDNLWIDVTANTISSGTCVGDDSTLNDTAIAAIIAAAPQGSVIFFPAGTYRFAAEININVDKRLAFRGAGKYASIIKTTSATANIFRKSVAGWYDSWTDLGFATSVNKTAGACISVDAGNNIAMNVYRCAFGGNPAATIFQGINFTGAQSGNVSVLFDLEMSGFSNGGRGIVINGSTINIQIHQTTINCGAATTSACLEINQSGAVQVTNFDWIQGTNVVLFNSTAGAGPQACYFTNGFFDQPQGSVVKFTGGNACNRIKFTEVGIAPTGNNHAVEIAGTGAGAVGTSTALPAGLSFVDCDIYNAGGTGTGAGILVNGCQDVNIQNSRITGFGGAGGAGIRIIPSSGNQTKVRINGCIFGPNSNLTVNNATHVEIQAGSSGLGGLSISDNQMDGATSAPMTDASAAVVGVAKRISQNSGLMAGAGSQQLLSSGGAAVIAGRSAVTSGTTETFMFTSKVPPSSVQIGQKFRVVVTTQFSGAGVPTFTLRSGAAGTIAGDTSICVMATTAQVANGYVTAEFIVEVVALGPTATVVAHGSGDGGNTAVASSASLFQTAAAEVVANVPTTAAWFITLGLACATAGTATVKNASVEAL